MMEFTHTVARLLDYPLGWTLSLPREAAIAIVALLTSLVLTLVRKFTTNQDRLKRCKQDLARLKVLQREHRQAKGKQAVERTRATSTTIKLIQMRAEVLGLLVSLVPIGALALWAVERLDYLPAKAGERLTLTAYFSRAAIESVAHLVPLEGVAIESPHVQIVAADPENKEQGIATWKLVPDTPVERLELTVRHEKQSAIHRVSVGNSFYEPPRIDQQGGAIVATEVNLRQTRFLVVVPGIPAIGLAPWLVAYLLLAIPLTPLVRYILKVS